MKGMRRSALSLFLLALALLVASCTDTPEGGDTTGGGDETVVTEGTGSGSGPEPDAPMFEPADCEFELETDREVECGNLEVPEDRDDPSAGTVDIHFAIFKSESSDPAPDPVVYLEGGPGGDALELMEVAFEDRFAHVLVDRDLIVFDQRGTGFTDPSLACPEIRDLTFEYLDEWISPAEFEPIQLATIIECRDRVTAIGADLDAYNSAASAADLNDLRHALGYDEWNLYGISYGTRLAMTTMRDYPEGLRSVILDSAYPLEVNLLTDTIGNVDRALDTLFAGCASDTGCNAAYPNLDQVFYDTLDTLQGEPITAPVTDVFTGTQYDAVFDGIGFGGVVFQSLYSAEVIPQLPKVIYEVANGETTLLSLLTTSFLANGEYVSFGMQLSVQCNEEVVFTNPDEVEAALAEYPDLAFLFEGSANVGPAMFDVCDEWGAGEAAAIENEPVTSDIPTMIMAGEYDPVTPPAWGQQVADQLSTSTVFEYPAQGHGPSVSSECAQEMLRAFLNDPTAAPDDSCIAEMGPVDFVVPGDVDSSVELVPFTTSVVGGGTISGVTPEGWEEVAPGVWARQQDALDQTLIVQQFAPGTTASQLLPILAAQFGFDAEELAPSSYSSPSGEWDIYESSVSGFPASIGLLELPEGTMLTMVLASPEEYDALVDSLFYPALDAFELN